MPQREERTPGAGEGHLRERAEREPMKVKEESRVDGAPGLVGGKGQKRGGGSENQIKGKSTPLKRGHAHSPDASTNPCNLLGPGWRAAPAGPASFLLNASRTQRSEDSLLGLPLGLGATAPHSPALEHQEAVSSPPPICPSPPAPVGALSNQRKPRSLSSR